MATLSANGKYIDMNNVRLYEDPTGAIRLTCTDSDLDKPLSLILKKDSPQENVATELFSKMRSTSGIELKLGHQNGRKNLPVTLDLNDWSNPLMLIQGRAKSGKTTVLESLLTQVRGQFDDSDMKNSLLYIDGTNRGGDSTSRILNLSFKKLHDGVANNFDCKIVLFIDNGESLSSEDAKILDKMLAYARHSATYGNKKVFLRVFMAYSMKAFVGFGADCNAEAILHLTREDEPGINKAVGSLYFDDDPIENIVTEL